MSAEKDLVKAGGSLMAAGCLWMLLLPVLVAWSCEEPGARRAREVTGRKPAIVFAVTLAGGCATAAQTYDFDPVQSFTRPKAEVWQALVDVVTARGWPVRVIETDAGFLAVNELPLRESRVDCGKLGILAYWRGPPTGTVDMHVRDESDGTAHLRVTINASRMASVSGSTVVQTVLCNSRGELEGEVAREVRAKLEGRGTAPGLSSS
ncbi:MAG: hypothetical protein F4123_06480 [Gemmatimonadetes bacterium]|nr:hypothetical protein [Gemmatimonadota bacterium]MYB97946.1 hypothetical protein [Gemmatimonadota bacterium]MYI46008.1 hypothetical protein [Gemmatimonadota bacterium]